MFINELETFAVNSDLSIDVKEVGPNNNKISIIDNFYQHPEKVRNLALQIPASFSPKVKSGLPGGRCNVMYDLSHLGPVFEKIIKSVYTDISLPVGHVSNAFLNASFIVNYLKNDMVTVCSPHIDFPDPRAFAATVFLNSVDECAGGTGFYTLDSADSGASGNKERWNMHYLAEMKWNRCIVYQANVYHSAYMDKMFDDVCRINQMFFI